MYTSYNCLGSDAEESDAEQIIEMAGKASVSDQQKQVQSNVHSQIISFCSFMDQILLKDANKKSQGPVDSPALGPAQQRSGLSLAVGKSGQPSRYPAIPETRPLKLAEVSQSIKDLLGYTLAVKPSEIPHEEAGQGLFLDGEAEVGSVIAFYPGVVYSPAYYRYIPGYPRVDAQNPYLITRYDGNVINAQPWGLGGDSRDVWTGSITRDADDRKMVPSKEEGSDRFWRILSKPLPGTLRGNLVDVIDRRNPLAFAHFANHPAQGMEPNVMICPYDFPLSESELRAYIPNVQFGGLEEFRMKRFGSFWFKLGSGGPSNPILRTLVLVATRALCNEELLLNYRLSNSKRRPAWYSPVNEEEDRRRWS
ncbi:hypothetical protein SAY87_001039 [Trapa incisa]|uniref:Uncharacterized protein n=1 Tax=Trapa incisa TaxID=236973 RepID=A0AAN7GFJ2_9MYRT|nr:hypothetical protein SAY87_001039 [Trapa incisa]